MIAKYILDIIRYHITINVITSVSLTYEMTRDQLQKSKFMPRNVFTHVL